MAVIVAILAVIAVVLVAVVVVEELRVRAIRQAAQMELAFANKNVQMLVELVRKPSETPPDKLIASIGATINKIIAGQPMAVNENTQDVKVEEQQPYYPDVEFDEWLGAEGMPTAAGWWSPPKNDENTENIN